MSLHATVYEGCWIDWSQDNRLLGATLTLGERHGKYLISFLSVFITLVGGQVWQILCRVAFRLRSSPADRDGLSHQQQAILRNSKTDWGAFADICWVAWYWRRKTDNSLTRSLPLFLLATLHIAAFLAASILSSRISSARSNVLLVPNDCGTWDHAILPGNNDIEQWMTWGTLRILLGEDISASQAITTCSRGKSDPSQCSPLGRNISTYTVTSSGTNASSYNPNALNLTNVRIQSNGSSACPFDPVMCVDGVVYTLDSGLVDSHNDLGINSAKQDRIQYRNRLDCAPLATDNFSETVGTPENSTSYWYGSSGPQDYTFKHDLLASDAASFGGFIDQGPFQVVMINSYDTADLATFSPIPQLRRDGNTVLQFLRRNVKYLNAVSDPWFSTNLTGSVGVLGCLDRRFYCNGEENCIPISPDIANISLHLGLNPRQASILDRLNRTIAESSFYITNSMSAEAVLANDIATLDTIPTLPNNQWMAEIQNWFSIGLVQLQLQTAQYVTSLGDVSSGVKKIPPSTNGDWMCRNQIVIRKDHTSFSLLGLVIVLVVGSLLIGISLCLDPLVKIYDKFRKTNGHQSVEWTTDGLLQLQRYAYQGHGMGSWTDMSADVPVTREGECFGLPRTDYPREQADETSDSTPLTQLLDEPSSHPSHAS